MIVLMVLLGAGALVWSLPSQDWRDTATSDKDFKRIQEHLSGSKRQL